MNYSELYQAVQSTAGLRLRLRLQPLYGPGEIVFPPTWPEPAPDSSGNRFNGNTRLSAAGAVVRIA